MRLRICSCAFVSVDSPAESRVRNYHCRSLMAIAALLTCLATTSSSAQSTNARQIIFQDPFGSLDPAHARGRCRRRAAGQFTRATGREPRVPHPSRALCARAGLPPCAAKVAASLRAVGPRRIRPAPLSPRIFRRTAPAHRHRPRPGAAPAFPRGSTNRSAALDVSGRRPDRESSWPRDLQGLELRPNAISSSRTPCRWFATYATASP